ncbi:MAG: hypothetical protein BMS9Abin01_0400 [Gammaproteobacteria bacterium]|nr:MAG: hypothetical protein BMS9Abin01_0400 [Gammaproteobacteria bacterium]
MSKQDMNRRQFLQTSGLAVVGAAAVGPLTMIVDLRAAWALSLDALDKHTAETLVTVCRQMYPHDAIGDAYYSRVVEVLDQKAAGDAAVGKLLKEGVAELDGAYGIAWLDLSDGYQLAALEGIESGSFFQTVRSTTVGTLYNDPLVWRHLGYEGPVWDLGGYIDRGFDDLGWLPDVS